MLFPLSASQTQWSNSGVNLHFKGIHAEQEDFPRQSKQGLEVVWSYSRIQGIFFGEGLLQAYYNWKGDLEIAEDRPVHQERS